MQGIIPMLGNRRLGINFLFEVAKARFVPLSL